MKIQKTNIDLIKIDLIKIDGGTQPRVSIDEDYVAELVQVKEAPPLDVFFDGAAYWLADGFHRMLAAQRGSAASVACRVHKGARRDAVLFSVGANARHGLRRTNADKRKSVLTLLEDKEWGKRSSRWIAEACSVSHDLVCDVKESIQLAETPTESKVNGVDGKVYKSKKTAPKDPLSFDDELDAIVPASEEEPAAEPEAPAEPATPNVAAPAKVHDQEGGIISDPDVAAIFLRRDEVTAILRAISDAKGAVIKAADAGDTLYSFVNVSQYQANLQNAYQALSMGSPHAICPYCKNAAGKNGCKACHRLGWVSKIIFKHQTPEDLKK